VHNSAPPVVSTVATPLATYQDSLADAPSGSSWRGVVMGTVLGLAIVSAFVAGARLAHRSTVAAGEAAPPAAAIAPPPAATTVPPAQTAPSPPPAAPPAVQEPGPPAIAATLLPTVKPPRSVKAAKPVAAKLATTPPPAASAPVQATAVESPDPAPADSAPSLLPVIPPAPKPTVDPFVRAVQQDIQEDQSSGH